MQKVAEYDQVTRSRLLKYSAQAVEVGEVQTRWHRDACLHKGVGLAKVNIGDKERRGVVPVDGALRQQ